MFFKQSGHGSDSRNGVYKLDGSGSDHIDTHCAAIHVTQPITPFSLYCGFRVQCPYRNNEIWNKKPKGFKIIAKICRLLYFLNKIRNTTTTESLNDTWKWHNWQRYKIPKENMLRTPKIFICCHPVWLIEVLLLNAYNTENA